MKYPRISIITPSYNQGKFIEQTIRSVVSQHYPNLEYLIFDGRSTDNTVSIIKKYAKKYKFIKWVSRKDGGQVDAINRGLKKATGDIVTYINSDDYYLPGTLKQIAEKFMDNPDKYWLAGYCEMTGEGVLGKLVRKYTNFFLNIYSQKLLLILNCVSQPSVFMRKTVIKKVGLFDQKYKLAFDYDYWLRLGKMSRPILIKQPLAVFRVHTKSLSSNHFKKQFTEQYISASSHTSNKLLLVLHSLHTNLLILPVYSFARTIRNGRT